MPTNTKFPAHITEQQVLFLSDVHLGAFSEPVNHTLEDEILRLLDYIGERKIRLVILGDLFDYWMEYPGFTPSLDERLRDRFKEYHASVGPTLFITGNHDCWTRDHFKELGFDIESEYRVLELDGKKGLLLHGDGLKDDQFNYPRPQLHRFLRNEHFISIYQKIFPPTLGIRMMRLFSQAGKLREGYTDETSKLDQWAQQTLQTTRFEFIICGHHHHRRFVQTSAGLYINLGAYFRDHTLAFFSDRKLTRVTWPGSCFELLPDTTSHT